MSLSAWNSFLSAGSNTLSSLLPADVKPAVLPLEQQQKDNNDDDLTFNMVNKGTALLVKQTGQGDIAARLEADNRVDAERRMQKKSAGKAPPPSPAASGGGGAGLAPRSRAPKATNVKKEVAPNAPPPPPPPASRGAGTAGAAPILLPSISTEPLPIFSLEQYTRREQEADAFTVPVTVQRTHDRVTNQQIINLPPETEVFKYVATNFRDEAKWYDSQIKYIANNPNLTFQKVPLMSRAMLETFMRVPDPKVSWERPCCNLDRDPFPHEVSVRCVAHALAGYRLREMHMNDTATKINAAIANKQNPMVHLSPVPEMCFLCHIYMTTLNSFNKDLQASDGLLNRFCVDVDKIGEYDSRKMLTEGNIWGNFPMWNRRHYIPCTVLPSNLPGFVETPDLLFRLPRVPFQVSLNANASSHYTLSSATPAALPLSK